MPVCECECTLPERAHRGFEPVQWLSSCPLAWAQRVLSGCTEAVNSRKLPASRWWGRAGHGVLMAGSLALRADAPAPGTAAHESSNQSVFAHYKRDVCEGPGGEAWGCCARVLTGPTEAIVSCWGGGGEGAQPELWSGDWSCWVIFPVFYSRLPNTVAYCS